MPKCNQHTIGVMDPNSLSFRVAFEKLIEHLAPDLMWNGERHRIQTRRIMCRPYDTLNATSSCTAIMNRGAHWNPHHNSFFMIIMHDVYLLNDMISFKAIDKNTAYAHMARLGLNVPPTAAIPQKDYASLKESESIQLDLVFSEFEMFDLFEAASGVGYPAFLKPQDGGGWVGVSQVKNAAELQAAYDKSGERPMNLQKAIDFQEFVRTVGVGPQMMPMHYNPDAEHSHDRYLRNPGQAVQQNFLSVSEFDEVTKITKIINAFYNWDHNSCEILIGKDGICYPIDYANAYPDSTVISLHYYFPELVKSMVRWLSFVSVTGHKKRVDFAYDHGRYFKVKEEAKAKGWDYRTTLDRYAQLADEHFATAQFNDFLGECWHANGYEEKCLEYFESDGFLQLIDEEIERYFKIPAERAPKHAHYGGIHKYWAQCERERISGKPVGA